MDASTVVRVVRFRDAVEKVKQDPKVPQSVKDALTALDRMTNLNIPRE